MSPIVIAAILLLVVVAYLLFGKGESYAFGDGKRPKTLMLCVTKRENVSHDTIRLTLGLPSSAALGLPCGKHLSLAAKVGGRNISRPYTPTSDGMRTKGSVELVIKVYKPLEPRFPEGGAMSQHVDSLEVGDEIKVRGPFGAIHYQGRGRFRISGEDVETKHIGMFAGGTGITPMLQIINEIIQDPADMTNMSLLFANKKVDDILVREELEASKKKAESMGKVFNLHYTLDEAPEDWKYSEGFVNQEMIKGNMPAPGENPVMMFCGPPLMFKFAVAPHLETLGYPEARTFKF